MRGYQESLEWYVSLKEKLSPLRRNINRSLLVYRLVHAPVRSTDRAKAGFDSPTESFFLIFPHGSQSPWLVEVQAPPVQMIVGTFIKENICILEHVSNRCQHPSNAFNGTLSRKSLRFMSGQDIIIIVSGLKFIAKVEDSTRILPHFPQSKYVLKIAANVRERACHRMTEAIRRYVTGSHDERATD